MLGASLCARDKTCPSLPVKPNLLKVYRSGLSCGANTPWVKPSSCKDFIFAKPCLAALLGFEMLSALFSDATFPSDNPA